MSIYAANLGPAKSATFGVEAFNDTHWGLNMGYGLHYRFSAGARYYWKQPQRNTFSLLSGLQFSSFPYGISGKSNAFLITFRFPLDSA